MDIDIPPKYQMLIDLRPYFDDQENLLNMDDEELTRAWAEMKFIQKHANDLIEEYSTPM